MNSIVKNLLKKVSEVEELLNNHQLCETYNKIKNIKMTLDTINKLKLNMNNNYMIFKYDERYLNALKLTLLTSKVSYAEYNNILFTIDGNELHEVYNDSNDTIIVNADTRVTFEILKDDIVIVSPEFKEITIMRDDEKYASVTFDENTELQFLIYTILINDK